MPRTRSLAWAELKIGVVTVVAIIIATFVIFQLSGVGGFFWQRYGVKTVFADVAGLKEGAPVRLAGMEVGSVTAVALNGDRVEVEMQVGREHRTRITSDSIASLGSVSLLGEAAVDITSASGGTPIPEWGYVPSGRSTGTIGDVTAQASVAMEEASALVNDLRSGRGTIGKLLTDDVLYREMTSLIMSVEDLTTNINRGRGTLGRLASDPAAARSLEASLDNLQ